MSSASVIRERVWVEYFIRRKLPIGVHGRCPRLPAKYDKAFQLRKAGIFLFSR